LGYSTSAATWRSLLTSVTEYGSDGLTALPKVRFRYQHERGGWASAGWSIPPEASFTRGTNDDLDNAVRVGDVNGDGLPDLVQSYGTDAGKHRVWMNNGSGWELSSWSVPIEAGFIMDDGRDNAVVLADVNGDGRADLMQSFGTDSGKHRVWLNNGAGWSLSSWGVPLEASFVMDDGRDNGVRLADVNGDGLADLVQSYGTDTGKHRTWLNNRAGWSLSASWSAPTEAAFANDGGQDTGVRLADVNGDGLEDLVQSAGASATTHRVWLNNNAGWDAPTSIVPFGNEFVEGYARLADVNGDGRIDFIQADGGQPEKHRVWFNLGLAWDNPVYGVPVAFTKSLSNHADNGVRLTDANGDGLTDLLQNNTSQHYLWLGNGLAPDLLVEVTNGIGGLARVAYKPSTAYDNTGGDGLPDLPFVVQTAYAVTTDDGMGHSYTIQTAYSGGLYDAADREYRGFRYAKVTDPEGHYTEQWFHQDSIKKGKPEKIEAHAAGGALLQQVSNTWAYTTPYAGSTFVYLAQVETLHVDGGSNFITRTRYQYDAYGNVTAQMNEGDVALAGDEVYAYTEYAVNTSAWILSLPSHTMVKDAAGTLYAQAWHDYDGLPNGQVQKGNLTKKRFWLYAGTNPEVSYAYDSYGNVVSSTDARGKTTTTTYDSAYHAFPNFVINPLGYQTISVYDPKTGQPLQVTDTNGNTTRTLYDLFGVPAKVIKPYDNEAYPTLSYQYALRSLPIKVTVAGREKSGQHGEWLSYAYSDGLGRSLQKVLEARGSNQFTVQDSVVYNARGLVQHQLTPFFTTGSGYVPADLGRTHSSFDYDGLARLTRTTNPDGSTMTRQYLGRKTCIVDEGGHRTCQTVDGLGRLVLVEEENGAEVYRTTYSYDPLNNLLQTTDNAGNVSTMSYDTLGRKVAMHDPDMGNWTYAYDANGNLTRQTDAKGQMINFAYDDLNRLILKDYPTGTDVVYTYDAADVPNGIGRLTRVSDSAGTTAFEYDALGRATKEQKTVDGVSYVVLKSYDALGRLTRLVYPGISPSPVSWNSPMEV